MKRRKPITAKEAVSRVLATGWQSDALAEDAAVEAMRACGRDEGEARAEVRKEIQRLQVTGAN